MWPYVVCCNTCISGMQLTGRWEVTNRLVLVSYNGVGVWMRGRWWKRMRKGRGGGKVFVWLFLRGYVYKIRSRLGGGRVSVWLFFWWGGYVFKIKSNMGLMASVNVTFFCCLCVLRFYVPMYLPFNTSFLLGVLLPFINCILTYLLMYGAEPFLRSCQSCSHSGNSKQI
jgi:hypothetical protein